MLQRQHPYRHIKIYSNIHIVGQEWIKKFYIDIDTLIEFDDEVICDVKQFLSLDQLQLVKNNQYKFGQRYVEDFHDILDLPPNSIFIYDESQSDFSCNLGKNEFPEDLLRRITQVRKKQFAMFMTSPKYNRMNINIRESVNFVILCKNIMQMDRWFSYVFYHAEDYEDYRENKIKLMTHRYLKFSFVTQDRDYRQYDTKEEVSSIKTQEIEVKKKDLITISEELKKLKNEIRNEIYKEIDNKLKKVNA